MRHRLTISCDKAETLKTDCAIYRPDGSLYFKGEFIFDGKRTGTPEELNFKYFTLTDRTIQPKGGRTFVAKYATFISVKIWLAARLESGSRTKPRRRTPLLR
jgi:hypothetical protein